jgi:hypothetical protein
MLLFRYNDRHFVYLSLCVALNSEAMPNSSIAKERPTNGAAKFVVSSRLTGGTTRYNHHTHDA